MAFYGRKFYSEKPGPAEEPESDSKPVSSFSYPPPLPKHPIPTRLVLSLGIVGAAFLFLSYFAMRRYASRRRSSPPLVNHNNREDFTDGLQGPVIDHPIWYIRTIGLSQSVVDSIEMLRYKKGDGLIETSDCSVCLSEFEEGERLRLLPKCSHAFHVACIDTWLRSHTNCPLCRAPILVVNGNQSSPVESSSSSSLSGEGESEREGGGDVEDDGVMIGREMEAIRRSVSLDFFFDVEAKNPVSTKRSMSLSLN